jgi:hypothetical protein
LSASSRYSCSGDVLVVGDGISHSSASCGRF